MSYKPDSAVTWLVQHYSATYIENEYTFAQLERDHLSRGFREAGYHYYITYPRNGRPARVITGRDLSQPGRFETGAHSKGENDDSIGICLEGGLTKATGPNTGLDTRHPDQIALQIELLEQLKERFPNAIIEGHRDMPGAATQCPGYNARHWWEEVQRQKLKPVRESVTQSKAVRTSAGGIATAVGGGVTAVGTLEGNSQVVALVFCGIVALAFVYLMRDRIKKWGEGVR